MIDGSPEIITLVLDNFTVSKNASNITFNNNISSVNEYQGYTVDLSANAGYVISSVEITMGGKRNLELRKFLSSKRLSM